MVASKSLSITFKSLLIIFNLWYFQKCQNVSLYFISHYKCKEKVSWKLVFQMRLYIILKEKRQHYSQSLLTCQLICCANQLTVSIWGQHWHLMCSVFFFFQHFIQLTHKTFWDLCSAEINCTSWTELFCIYHDFERKKKDAREDYEYVMRCVIWYHLYNLKNVKNTHGGVLILVKLQN